MLVKVHFIGDDSWHWAIGQIEEQLKMCYAHLDYLEHGVGGYLLLLALLRLRCALPAVVRVRVGVLCLPARVVCARVCGG